MKIEWLNEAHNEFRKFVTYYVTQVGNPHAEKLPKKILRAVAQLADFPEMGVLKYDTLMGKYEFHALFIAQYVCVYKIENDTGQTGACRKNEKFCSRPFSITLSPVSGTITVFGSLLLKSPAQYTPALQSEFYMEDQTIERIGDGSFESNNRQTPRGLR